jgi:hypothetical protein
MFLSEFELCYGELPQPYSYLPSHLPRSTYRPNLALDLGHGK